MSEKGQINYLINKEGLTDITISATDGLVLCNGEIIDPLISHVVDGDCIVRLEPSMEVKNVPLRK